MKLLIVFVAAQLMALNNGYAQIQTSSSFVNFPQIQVGTSGFEKIWVRNLSSNPENIKISHSCYGDLSITDNCFIALQQYQSCTLDVWFRPLREGYASCQVWIHGKTNSVNIQVQGYGQKY